METKSIDPAALAGITTGILMTDFSVLHEAAEWIAGHPIWTHQFPALADDLRDAVLAQFPDMPTEVGEEGWKSVRDAVRARYGVTVEVRKGSEKPISKRGLAVFERELSAARSPTTQEERDG